MLASCLPPTSVAATSRSRMHPTRGRTAHATDFKYDAVHRALVSFLLQRATASITDTAAVSTKPSRGRWSEAAPELTGRTDGNKRVVFPDSGVVDGLGRYSTVSSARPRDVSLSLVPLPLSRQELSKKLP